MQWDLATHPFRLDTGHSPFLTFAKNIKKNQGDLVVSRGIRCDLDWYAHGKSSNPMTYLQRFQQMVEQCRTDLADKELPFLTVQLNRCSYEDHPEGNRSWGIVREMQRRAAHNIPRVYVVPSLGCDLSDEIHTGTAGNTILGGRMARMALAEVYGTNTAYKAPDIHKAWMSTGLSIGNPTITVQFNHVQKSLYAPRPNTKAFFVEDDEGPVDIVSWETCKDVFISMILSRETVGTVKIHGAHEVNPAFMLPFDTGTGLPMLAFYGFEVAQGR